MPTFLIADQDKPIEESSLHLVTADSEVAALPKYVNQVAIQDAGFLEYVYDRDPDMSLAEEFLFDADEQPINPMSDAFAERVQSFFDESPGFAKVYIAYMRDYPKGKTPPSDHFPDEMLTYIWFNTPGWARLVMVNLDKLPHLT